MKFIQWCKSKLQWIGQAINTSWWWAELQDVSDDSLFMGFLSSLLVLLTISVILLVVSNIIILLLADPVLMFVILGVLGASLWMAIIARRQYRTENRRFSNPNSERRFP